MESCNFSLKGKIMKDNARNMSDNAASSPNKTTESKQKLPQIDSPLPSAKEMRVFARGFTPHQWSVLITSPEFIKSVETDLDKAAKIANNYFPITSRNSK